MSHRSLGGIALVLGAVGCGRGPAPPAPEGVVTPPLTPTTLIEGQFVAYTLLWQVSAPGGDPIVFQANGTVENLRAGLAGRWTIVDDSTLLIESADRLPGAKPKEFRLRHAEGDLVSPLPPSGERRSPLYWIRRRGSAAPRE